MLANNQEKHSEQYWIIQLTILHKVGTFSTCVLFLCTRCTGKDELTRHIELLPEYWADIVYHVENARIFAIDNLVL